MEEAMAPGSRAWLTLQWRNALSLLTVAILLGCVGILTIFLVGVPRESVLLLGLVIAALTAAFAGTAAYLFHIVARGEAKLRTAGTPWRAERSLVGATRRSLVTEAAPESSLQIARDLLLEPRLGLTHVGRGVLRGVRAVRPAETGLLVMSVVPLAVGIRARRRQGRTVLSISVVPSSVYGWPLLSGWVGWSAMYNWIGVAQALADDLSSTLARTLTGRVE